MYSLIYIERPNDSSTADAILGPFFFQTSEEAIKKVYTYSVGRIISCCAEFFIESYSQFFSEIKEISESDSGDATTELKKYLESIEEDAIMEGITEWYFEYANDDLVDAYYSVDEVIPEVKEGSHNGLNVPFNFDDIELPNSSIDGVIESQQLCLVISFNGYSDHGSEDDKGYPIIISKRKDKLHLSVYTDINNPDATHEIDLEGARNKNKCLV